MSTIDWSKAPEGTTHFGPKHDFLVENWFKRDECGWSIWECARWAACRGGLQKLREDTMVRRPPQKPWAVEGLPPVGTVCEFAGGTPCPEDPFDKDLKVGMKVTIIAHFKCGDFTLAAFTFDPKNQDRGMVQVEQGNFGCFRPIRTPEQIAAEEREKARDEVLNAMAEKMAIEKNETLWQHRLQVVGEMLDMGYRKQVMP
jgi:hypothetical protein